jgi:thymidylate synthase (FAD)
MEFYHPVKWRMQSGDNKQVTEGEIDGAAQRAATTYASAAYEHAKHTYQELLDLGVGREMARMVLPVGLYTEFYGTVNLHNLFHFIELRDHEHAQREIRWPTLRLKELASRVVPRTFSIWDDLRD